jgi:hypothetical protein
MSICVYTALAIIPRDAGIDAQLPAEEAKIDEVPKWDFSTSHATTRPAPGHGRGTGRRGLKAGLSLADNSL